MSKATIDLYNAHRDQVTREEANRARLADDEPQAPLRHAQTFREPWGRPQLGPLPPLSKAEFDRFHGAPSPDYSTRDTETLAGARKLLKEFEQQIGTLAEQLHSARAENAWMRATLATIEKLLAKPVK